MDPIDLDHLEAAAKAAMPEGEWSGLAHVRVQRLKALEDLANPQTILALIHELREHRQEEEVDAALIATLRKENEALRAELREHRQAEEIQMRTEWTATKVGGKWGVFDLKWMQEALELEPNVFYSDTPKAALVAANEWMKQHEKGGAVYEE